MLGLPFAKRWGEMPAGEFETGNLTIALMQTDAFGIEFSPHATPIAQADTMDSGVCRMAFFADPDGNALMLHHRYAPDREGP